MQEVKAGFERKPIEAYPKEWVEVHGSRWIIPNEGAQPSCMTNRIEVPLKVRRAILVPGNVSVLSADFSGAYIEPRKTAPRSPLSWHLHSGRGGGIRERAYCQHRYKRRQTKEPKGLQPTR